MAGARGGSTINIAEDIVENGDSYDFYQAVKLLNRLGSRKSDDASLNAGLRIQPELNLDYPQSDISDISRDEGTGDYNITTTFFGLYGVSSPLPGFYTEELLDDEWDELSLRKNFFDVIHNHIYPLLYQAWLKYKFSHNAVEFGNKNYSEIIFSLIGLSEAYRQDIDQHGYLLKYSGLLSQRVKSLLGLKTILEDYLGEVRLNIRPCVERKVAIVKEQHCLLGQQNVTIDSDACIGQNVVDRSGKFCIEIGPLNLAQFKMLMQDDKAINWIKTLLRLYLVQPLEYNVTFLLEPGAIEPACIGNSDSSVLGGNCWLLSSSNDTTQGIDVIKSDA